MKQKLRKQILDIRESVRYLMSFRKNNLENDWSEAMIHYSLKLQSKLLTRYQKKFGEFPFEIVGLHNETPRHRSKILREF